MSQSGQQRKKVPFMRPRRPKNSPFVTADGAPLEDGDPAAELQARAEADMLRNVPPHSVEAEQAVLSGILLTPDIISEIMGIVKAEDFYLPAHRLIFTACVTLYDQKAPVDIVALKTYLQDHGLLEESGGAIGLANLMEIAVSSARADYYAGIVRDKSLMRALISSCSSIISRSFEPGIPVKNLIDESETRILAVGERGTDKTYKLANDLSQEFFTHLTKLAQNKGSLTGINTGYNNLNNLTGGFQKSDLIILAARPGMGKTALALNLAANAAIDNSMHPTVPVAIFSLEMSMDQLIQRMLCSEGRVDLSSLRRNMLTDDDWNGLMAGGDRLRSAKIFIDDTPALSIGDLRARTRRMHREHKIGLVLVDYLQLMRSSSRVDSRELEISEISRGLKSLAKELDIAVIALSQLNRKVEERGDKRPMLSDLRESGAIEQDADLIMFVYRQAMYDKNDDKPKMEPAEIIIGKHRNGQTGTARLMYLPGFTRFDEATHYVTTPFNG